MFLTVDVEKMSITQKTFIFFVTGFSSRLSRKRNCSKSMTVEANKRNSDENRESLQPSFPLRISNTILSRSVVAVLGLGFVDAG